MPTTCLHLQSTVGTVVKSVGEEDDGTDRGGDPLGVISVLNTERYRQLNCLEEIKAYLLSRCHHPECKATLEKVCSCAVIEVYNCPLSLSSSPSERYAAAVPHYAPQHPVYPIRPPPPPHC